MNRAVIRADGSKELGMGHIMRSIGLAQGFRKKGIETLFLTKDVSSAPIRTINDYGFEAKKEPADLPLQEDLTLIKQVAGEFNADLIVTDLCNAEILEQKEKYEKYLKGLGKSPFFLITIDDLNTSLRFNSDIVVNPNYGIPEDDYVSQPEDTELLLGPKYFIFRDEFIEAAKKQRKIKETAKNILVSVGGSDQLSVNEKVAEALVSLEVEDLHVKFILGIDSDSKGRLESILASFKGEVNLIEDCSNMAEQMLWADLAITGGGLTKYETAVTGTPSIILSQARHQHDLMRKFKEEKTCRYLGLGKDVSFKDISNNLADVIGDVRLREAMSSNGKEIVDGNGKNRILREIDYLDST